MQVFHRYSIRFGHFNRNILKFGTQKHMKNADLFFLFRRREIPDISVCVKNGDYRPPVIPNDIYKTTI